MPVHLQLASCIWCNNDNRINNSNNNNNNSQAFQLIVLARYLLGIRCDRAIDSVKCMLDLVSWVKWQSEIHVCQTVTLAAT